ncbi:hypothetical protein ACFVHW_07770 [Streptomyces sp. NPDC127110]|uniref:hypothetical protein n=1 Tax=Streptomyces sp. NPDC127110 TaxID=3345362 RepID=UPI00362C3D64
MERSTLVFITLIAALVGGWAAWAAAKGGHDPVTAGSVVYGVVAGGLAKLFGGAATVTVVRSLLLIVGGVLGVVASLLLGRAAGIHLTPTTS